MGRARHSARHTRVACLATHPDGRNPDVGIRHRMRLVRALAAEDPVATACVAQSMMHLRPDPSIRAAAHYSGSAPLSTGR